ASSRPRSRPGRTSWARASPCAPSCRCCPRSSPGSLASGGSPCRHPRLQARPRARPLRRSIPLERSFLPLVNEADHQDGEEDRHCHEPERAERVQGHGPGKEKGDLEVEDDEENRDQVIADVESHAGVLERLEAALVRREFLRVFLPPAEEEAGAQQHDADGSGHAEENQDWDVLDQHGGEGFRCQPQLSRQLYQSARVRWSPPSYGSRRVPMLPCRPRCRSSRPLSGAAVTTREQACRTIAAMLPRWSSCPVVPTAGIDPARLAPLPPQDGVSTNTTTSANCIGPRRSLRLPFQRRLLGRRIVILLCSRVRGNQLRQD